MMPMMMPMTAHLSVSHQCLARSFALIAIDPTDGQTVFFAPPSIIRKISGSEKMPISTGTSGTPPIISCRP